ncbi:MAG: hypothetical protein KDK36_08900 [Leptospiraceae bacterium]|nr:hypothetical protein [Leptospiraceae bacterium]
MVTYFFISSSISFLLVVALYSYLKTKGKKKNYLFYTGIFYIIVNLPIIYSFYIFFALASIGIGILFLLLSLKKFPLPFEIFLSLIPIIILTILLFISSSSNNIFLIPEGYKGRVVIIHGCKDGTDREFDGTYRVYRVGKNGLLKTKFNFAGSSFDHLNSKYFYIDDAGNKTELFENQKEKVHPFGLWTLQYERKGGETTINFIVDNQVEEPYQYKNEQNEFWQREIDSCL